jgi:hypothetical protein
MLFYLLLFCCCVLLVDIVILILVFVFCCVFVFQLSVWYFVGCLMMFLYIPCAVALVVLSAMSFSLLSYRVSVGTGLFCSVTSCLLPTVSVGCILQGFVL